MGCTTSKMLLVSSGVGQGLVNGPSLPIVFFDDSDPLMLEIMSSFVDDEKLSNIINCMKDAVQPQEGIDLFWN